MQTPAQEYTRTVTHRLIACFDITLPIVVGQELGLRKTLHRRCRPAPYYERKYSCSILSIVEVFSAEAV